MWKQIEVLKYYVYFVVNIVNLLDVIGQFYIINDDFVLLMFFQLVDVVNECGFIGVRWFIDNDMFVLVYIQVEVFEYVKIVVLFVYFFYMNNIWFFFCFILRGSLYVRSLGLFCYWVIYQVL